MMSKTQDCQKRILDKLAFLELKLERHRNLHLYDENIAMEDVICRLLNLVYGYQLVNLNTQKENYPGIDLGDEHNRIAVQVTSNNSRDKIQETLRKFQKNDFSRQYDRLVIFILGKRKNHSMGFETGGFPFSDKEDILDFSSLTKALNGLDLEKLEQIAQYLEQEFPYQDQEEPQRRPTPRLFIAGLMILLTAAFSLFLFHNAEMSPTSSTAETSPGEDNEDRKPTFIYETDMDWLRMDQAAAELGTQSQINVYKPPYGNEYDQCAALTVLYSNYSEYDRCITEFTVYAEDIQEDLSPNLAHEAADVDNTLQFICWNEGWSETGDFIIEYSGITPYEESDEYRCVDVRVDPDAVSSWKYPSIKPGECTVLPLFHTEDFLIDYKEPFEGNIRFKLMFRVYSEETGYEAMLPCWLFVSTDNITFSYIDSASGGDKNYVIWVETSKPQWQETYSVQQLLPGKETVRLPVFIVPEKSCTMTIRISFKTADGEIIQATPLENARFIVPYYDETPQDYVNGNLLDWDQIQGNEIFCFPFAKTDKIVAQPKPETGSDSDDGRHFAKKVTPAETDAMPISTAQELVDKITADPSGSFYLTRDIDLRLYNNGIWDALDHFSGILDGQGYAIRNFSCISALNGGLFQEVSGAVFKDLGIEALVISANKHAGVAAAMGNASFTNCYVTCKQIGSDGDVGGLIGSGSVRLQDVYVDVSIYAQPQAKYTASSSSLNCCTGGIVGTGTVEASGVVVYSDITVIGEGEPVPGSIRAGGLIGDSGEAAQISVADAKVDCRIYVKTVEGIVWKTTSSGDRIYKGVKVDAGGLIGKDTHDYGSGDFFYNNEVDITNCDLTVDIDLDVFGTAAAGGFIGEESGMNDGMVVTIDHCTLSGRIDAQCIDGTASTAGSCFGHHPEGESDQSTVSISHTKIQCKVTAQGGYSAAWGGTLSGHGNAGIVTSNSSVDVELSVIPGLGKHYIDGEMQ